MSSVSKRSSKAKSKKDQIKQAWCSQVRSEEF